MSSTIWEGTVELLGFIGGGLEHFEVKVQVGLVFGDCGELVGVG